MLLKAVVKIIIFPSQPYRKLQPTELMTEAGVDFSFRCLNLQPHSCLSPDCVQKFTRYFTNQEISQLFELGSTSESETCSQLEQLHGADRNHSDQVKSDISAIAEMGQYSLPVPLLKLDITLFGLLEPGRGVSLQSNSFLSDACRYYFIIDV